ncbi:MAG: stage II sporulation protein M [Desulfotomaculum sp.]|nr:stage II sporulation protein M [Desulfotomaculum sp.]
MIKILFNLIYANWLLCLLAVFFLSLGSILGILAVDYLKPEQVAELNAYLETFLNQATTLEIDTHQAVKSSIINNLTVILIIYLLGLTVIGMPLVWALLFIRGFALGFTVSFLTQQKSWQGILLAVIAIFPQNIVYIPAVLIGAVASLAFSILLIKRYFNSHLAVWPGFAGYNILMLLVAIMAVLAGLVEAYLTPWLINNVAMMLTG